jgi:hypothetical protein
MTKILIQYQKHGTAMYDASTPELLERAALYVLNMHNKWGFYAKPEPVPPLDFDADKIDELPESLREAATRRAKAHRNELRWYAEGLEFYNDVQKALADKDGDLALDLLHAHSRYEYERVEVETVHEAPVEW